MIKQMILACIGENVIENDPRYVYEIIDHGSLEIGAPVPDGCWWLSQTNHYKLGTVRVDLNEDKSFVCNLNFKTINGFTRIELAVTGNIYDEKSFGLVIDRITDKILGSGQKSSSEQRRKLNKQKQSKRPATQRRGARTK